MTDACAIAAVPIGRTSPGTRPATRTPYATPRTRSDGVDFHLRLLTLSTPRECAALFSRSIEAFGLDSFSSGELDLSEHDRTVVHLSHAPNGRAGLHADPAALGRDPILRELAVRPGAFIWSDLREEARSSVLIRRALNSAAAMGWHEGLVVPVHQPGGRIGFISLAGRCNILAPASRDALVLMSLHLHHHVRALLPRHGFAAPPLGLTDREMELIRLTALGMSDAAIGRELGIAGSTAHEYVEKAKRKVKVRSRTELAALAVSFGIIAL